MGNSVRGKTDIEVNGKKYILQFTTNALCELEDKTGTTIAAFVNALEKGDVSLKAVRTFMWAGLIEHHEDIKMKEAGQIIDGLGGVEGVMVFLEKAFGGSMPDLKQDGADEQGKKKAAA